MSFGKKSLPPPTSNDIGAEEEQASRAEEGVPVPSGQGETIVAVRWISRAFNQFAQKAPDSVTGKDK